MVVLAVKRMMKNVCYYSLLMDVGVAVILSGRSTFLVPVAVDEDHSSLRQRHRRPRLSYAEHRVQNTPHDCDDRGQVVLHDDDEDNDEDDKDNEDD